MKKGKTLDCTCEESGVEVLHLQTMWTHDWNAKEYVSIGVIPENARGVDGTISVQIVHFAAATVLEPGECSCKVLQACLTGLELDILIEALEKAKNQLERTI